MWILKNSKDLLEYIQSRSVSSCNTIKTFDFFAQLFLTPSWRTCQGSWSNCVSWKKNGQHRYKYLVLGRDRSYFVKKNHFDSTKMFSETDIINMLEFLIDNIYLLCLMDVFFNRQSAYLWVQTVLLFSPTCSFIRMRQTSYRGFSRKTKRS
jgi:hypothetical protein